MNVFLSYSLAREDIYIVTLIADVLRQNGFVVYSRHDFSSDEETVEANLGTKIRTFAHLFIGVIVEPGKKNNLVLAEWRFAKKSKIPDLLLVEEKLSSKIKNLRNDNIIKFSRANPSKAIAHINDRRNQIAHGETSNKSNWLPWLIGGAAAVAILKLLSDED